MTPEERLKKNLQKSQKKVSILEKMIEQKTRMLYNANKELIRQNSELQQFVYTASHDLKQPLRTISNFASLLSLKYKDRLDGDADEYINYITDSTYRLSALINDLLKIYTIDKSSDNVQIDLNKLLQNALTDIDSLIKEKKAVINYSILPTMNCNKIQIYQIFQNLISNAIKFSRDGITPVVNISATEQLKVWLFKIEDNGIGINPMYKDQIFDVFKRLHVSEEYNGSGIGLSQVKKIVEIHGGKIWVEPAEEYGSIFYFTLSK